MIGFRAPLAAALILGSAASVSAMQRDWSMISVGRGPQVVGNGQYVTQRRPIGNFRAIEVRDPADVEVRVGARPSITITADGNLLPLLRTGVRDGNKLVIESVRSYRTRRAPRITITVPQLSAFAIRGSGDATIDGVNSASLALAISGSGDIRARGRTGSLSVAISGSGDVDASGVAARDAAVVISGSGDALVRASGALTGVTQGSGDVRYIGRPASVAVRTAGSGSVVQAR